MFHNFLKSDNLLNLDAVVAGSVCVAVMIYHPRQLLSITTSDFLWK